MAASFTLELDTTAPVVVMDTPEYEESSRILTVPYTVSEVGVAGATFEADTGQVLGMGVTPESFVVQLPTDVSRTGTVKITARDEVDNTAEYERTISMAVRMLGAVAGATARLIAMVTARARYESSASAGAA